jgi:hypothetical protein
MRYLGIAGIEIGFVSTYDPLIVPGPKYLRRNIIEIYWGPAEI